MISADVQGISSLQNKLNALAKKAKTELSQSAVVGFKAPYAIFVHERPAHHDVGQWKFLETACKRYGKEAGRIIADAAKSGKSLLYCLTLGATKIKIEAQNLTPVDTGFLKESAYTAIVPKQ